MDVLKIKKTLRDYKIDEYSHNYFWFNTLSQNHIFQTCHFQSLCQTILRNFVIRQNLVTFPAIITLKLTCLETEFDQRNNVEFKRFWLFGLSLFYPNFKRVKPIGLLRRLPFYYWKWSKILLFEMKSKNHSNFFLFEVDHHLEWQDRRNHRAVGTHVLGHPIHWKLSCSCCCIGLA